MGSVQSTGTTLDTIEFTEETQVLVGFYASLDATDTYIKTLGALQDTCPG